MQTTGMKFTGCGWDMVDEEGTTRSQRRPQLFLLCPHELHFELRHAIVTRTLIPAEIVPCFSMHANHSFQACCRVSKAHVNVSFTLSNNL
jgi:hypothetical protein